MAYTTEERIFCVKRFYQTGNVTVQREFRVRLYCRKGPQRLTSERSVKSGMFSGVQKDFRLPATPLLFPKAEPVFQMFFTKLSDVYRPGLFLQSNLTLNACCSVLTLPVKTVSHEITLFLVVYATLLATG